MPTESDTRSWQPIQPTTPSRLTSSPISSNCTISTEGLVDPTCCFRHDALLFGSWVCVRGSFRMAGKTWLMLDVDYGQDGDRFA
jgi:hypothetical protein